MKRSDIMIVFLYKDLNTDDRDCVKYIDLGRKFECGHYFARINLTGPCFSTSIDYEHPVYENIKTILTKKEFMQLIEFDIEIGKLGYSIKVGDERYQKGMKLYEDIQPVFDKLKSMANKFLFEEIINEERIFMAEEYNLDDKDIDEIFDNYSLEYRDRGIISTVWDSIEDAAYEEAESLDYVNKQNERWFDYKKFGQDLLDGEAYIKLTNGRVVYLNY